MRDSDLDFLDEVTMQDVFDTIWGAFVIQGKKQSRVYDSSKRYGWTCVYNAPDGAHCAVGVLFFDVFPLEEEMNVAAIVNGLLPNLREGRISPLTLLHILEDVQQIHDATFVDLPRRLRRLAREHGCVLPESCGA